MEIEHLIYQLEPIFLDAKIDFDLRIKDRYEYHILNLSRALNIIDGAYLSVAEGDFLMLTPTLSPYLNQLAKMGFSVGILIRSLQRDLLL